MRRISKPFAYLVSSVFALGPLAGCGVFNPPKKDANGYHIKHFTCCGPTAIEAAINEYYRQRGIVFVKNPAPRKEISKHIQDNGQAFKTLFSFFDKEAVCATWSWEMKAVVKKYGFELITVNDFEKLDPSKDIALVLAFGKFLSRQWHWMCYPVDENIKTYFGANTKIDKIYLLQKK